MEKLRTIKCDLLDMQEVLYDFGIDKITETIGYVRK